MDLKSRLESHPVAILKKEISKTNVKGYSKMKKAEVVKLMVKHSDRFNHIQPSQKKENKKAVPKEEPKKKIKKIIKKKGGKVVSIEKKEEHPEGIHIHIEFKDGKKELKTFKTKKAGETAFKKIREERKTKRDYKTMKLMDGLKILDYSA
jgi:hypothetical protein